MIEHPLQDSIRELRRGYQSVSECLEQALAECDQRGAELSDGRRQLAEARRSLMESEKQLADKARSEAELLGRYAEFEQRMGTIQAELFQANEKTRQAQAESVQNQQRLEIQLEHSEQLRRQAERFEIECEASRQELCQLREQFMPWVESAAEAARLRVELAAVQEELSRLQEDPVAVPNPLLQEQLAAAQAERQQLESELDLLRNRGAELSETLTEQKRLAAADREQWNEELRQLRRAVERQAEVLAQRGGPAAAPIQAPEVPASRRSHGSSGGDTVVDSVLEQFQALQKNKVRYLASSSG